VYVGTARQNQLQYNGEEGKKKKSEPNEIVKFVENTIDDFNKQVALLVF
jgi:hypothetical protein